MKTETLLQLVKTAARVTGGRASSETSKYVRIKTLEGSITVSGDDQETAVTVGSRYSDYGSPGKNLDCVVDPKKVIAWLNEAGEDVDIKQLEDGRKLRLKSGTATTKIRTIDLPFPERKRGETGKVWEVDSSSIKRAIRLCKSATDTGIQVSTVHHEHNGNNALLFSSTDGRRAAYCEVPAISESRDSDIQIILTVNTLAIIADAVDGTVNLFFSESGVVVHSETALIQSSGVHGGKVRRLPVADQSFGIAPRDIVPAIRQAVSVGTDEDDVVLEFTPMGISVSLESADGGDSVSEVHLPIGVMGDITLDPRFLEQAFRAFGLDEDVRIGYTSNAAPFSISRDDGHLDMAYFIAPRVREN